MAYAKVYLPLEVLPTFPLRDCLPHVKVHISTFLYLNDHHKRLYYMYFIIRSVAEKLLNASQNVPQIHLEDVYWTGLGTVHTD